MELDLNSRGITTEQLQEIVWPEGVTSINLYDNEITSLTGVEFPKTLRKLILCANEIKYLHGFVIPPLLEFLDLSDNFIRHLNFETFLPGSLKYLSIAFNDTGSLCLSGTIFPNSLKELDLYGIRDVCCTSGSYVNGSTYILYKYPEEIRYESNLTEKAAILIQRVFLKRYRQRRLAALKIKMWWTALSFRRRGTTYKTALSAVSTCFS